MSIRTRIRQVDGKLAHRGWLGPSTGPLQRVARAVDRRLVTGTAGPAYVARLWDRLVSDAFTRDLARHSWTGLPSVHANHNYLVSGDRNIYWVDWMRDQYFPDGQVGDVLSLGCGTGHLDRIFAINLLVSQDIADNFDASDESHLSHVERLIQFENVVIREGRLPSDFKMFMLR